MTTVFNLEHRLKREQYRAEVAASRGLEYLGEGSVEYRGRYRFPCGCEHELAISRVNTNTWACPDHGTPELISEARLARVELLGSKDSTRKGSFNYRLPCGCVQPMLPRTVKSGRFKCNSDRCPDKIALRREVVKKYFDDEHPVTPTTPSVAPVTEPVTVDPDIEKLRAELASQIKVTKIVSDSLKSDIKKRDAEIAALKELVNKAEAEKRTLQAKIRNLEEQPVEVIVSGDFTQAIQACFSSNLAGGEYVPFYDVCKLFEVKTTDMGYALKDAGFFNGMRTVSMKGLNNGFKYMTFEDDNFAQIGVNLNAIAIMDSVITKYLKRMEKRAA